MSALELKGNPKKEYEKGTKADKQLLERLFGKPTFQPTIMERVKTMADVYALAGVNPKDYVIRKNMTRKVKRRIYAEKLDLIEEVLNEGWVIKMSDTSQKKWYPYFIWNGSGFGFSHAHYDTTYTAASLGSRFATRELAIYAGKTFIKEYNDFIMS